ncbi:MAG: hypothetical protein ABEJ03_01185 [Candidatus Nanohaloarchaea archaeon]
MDEILDPDACLDIVDDSQIKGKDSDLTLSVYGDVVDGDYGKKMTPELEAAVQDVMGMDYDEFQSEAGQEVVQKALQEAEDAPEATLLDDAKRRSRTGDLLEGYVEQLQRIDLDSGFYGGVEEFES